VLISPSKGQAGGPVDEQELFRLSVPDLPDVAEGELDYVDIKVCVELKHLSFASLFLSLTWSV
jgi:hypothetical protein